MIDYLAHLRADVDAVLAVLSSASGSEPVPGCPGWNVRKLVEHLGATHRWATLVVQTGTVQAESEESPRDLAGWFAAGASELVAELSAADPAEPCWSFTRDRTKGFWLRRQALETAVHRWDAQSALGEAGPVDSALAAAGVAEVVDLLAPWQVRLGRIPSLPAAVELLSTDTQGRWVLGSGEVAATVAAPAEVLLLLLWRRLASRDPRVRTTGDAAKVLGLALTP